MQSDDGSTAYREELRSLIEQQHHRLEEQQAELERLEQAVQRAELTVDGAGRPVARARVTRAGLLKTALMGTATVAGAGLLSQGGQGVARAATTAVFSADGAGNVAVEGDGSNGAVGVKGISDNTSPANEGVRGEGPTGVRGHSTDGGFGVLGTTTSGYAVVGKSDVGTGVAGETFTDQVPPAGVIPPAGVRAMNYGKGPGLYASSASDDGMLGVAIAADPEKYGVVGKGPNGIKGDGTIDGGFGVLGVTTTGRGVTGMSTNDSAGTGVLGQSQSSATNGGAGVIGTNNNTGPGVVGLSAAGYGGSFQGSAAQVHLEPNGTAPPSNGKTGDLFADTSGRLWYCTASGPGATWKKIV